MYNISIILANSKNDGMNSNLPVYMHKVCGCELVKYVFNAVKDISANKPIIVTENKEIGQLFGDEVVCATEADLIKSLNDKDGYVTVVNGNMPFIKKDTLKAVGDNDFNNGYSAYALSKNGEEISACRFNISDLIFGYKTVNKLNIDEIFSLLNKNEKKVGIYNVSDQTELIKIYDRVQLAQAEKIMRKQINEKLMLEGVTIIDSDTTYIEAGVKIGKDTIIYPSNVISNNTVIGENCIIYPGNRIDNAQIGDFTDVEGSVILSSSIGSFAHIGPKAYIRPDSVIGNHTRIGDFVEIKKAVIGDGTKVSHLTYVGDAEVGKNCNMGCGTVFVNYDGTNKHKTVVGDHVFIGCNANLIAPLNIGDNSLIAAGSTVTESIEESDMCIARARQTTKKGWVNNYKNWHK